MFHVKKEFRSTTAALFSLPLSPLLTGAMGRPSRKRPRPPAHPRPPPYSHTEEAESSASRHESHVSLASHPFSIASGSNDLQTLVFGTTDGGTRITDDTKAGQHADEETGPTAVQQVWGALSEADIATAPGNVEVDEVGVAWLVNTALRQSEMGCRKNTPNLPQHSITDHDGAATAEAAVAAVFDSNVPLVSTRQVEDEIKVKPSPGAPLFSCDASFGEKLSKAKGEFDEIPVAVFKRVRSACNPAEALGRGSFLNRSAMKLANIDAIVAGKLALGGSGGPQEEEDEQPQERAVVAPGGGERGAGCETVQAKALLHSIQPAAKKTLLFADLCGGPGGFSEYLLRRRRHTGLPARGWGISLREGDGGGGSSGTVVIDRTAVNNCGDAANVGEHDCDDDNNGGGHRSRRSSLFIRDEGTETAIVPEKPDSTLVVERPPLLSAKSMASRSSDGLVEKGSSRRHGGHQGDDIKKEEDPCAWRLDHLQPWCDVSVSTVSIETPATATTKFPGEGDIPKYAKPTAASANTASAVPPLFEMRIDYGPAGTGDVTDLDNMQGFVDTVLASTAGCRLDLVVADGGFGAARDTREQEMLLSPLLHSEAGKLNRMGSDDYFHQLNTRYLVS